MDKRIIKTAFVIFAASTTALITPIFGHWCYKTTGVMPYGFYAVITSGGLILTFLSILKIWGEIK